jgi:hypothetical protein
MTGADVGITGEAALEPILTTAASFSLSCVTGCASSLNGSIPSNQAKILETIIALNIEHFCLFSLNIDILYLCKAKIAAPCSRKLKLLITQLDPFINIGKH